MAFQGAGGGLKQSERIIGKLKEAQVPLVLWATEQDLLNEFEAGHVLWCGVKESLVPLISSIAEQSEWQWIKETAEQLVKVEKA